MLEKTVIILGEDMQITLDGNVKIVDAVGCKYVKETEEVVGEVLECDQPTDEDSTLVHCYTITKED